jgi:ABC-type nitrate/sulfonate/bicarbonate transport system substrate-binding protein
LIESSLRFETSDRLTNLARAFDRMRWAAEKPEASDAFVNVVDAAGKMTEASLQQLATLLEIVTQSGAVK